MHHHVQRASATACREEFKVVPSLVLRQGFTEAEGTGVNGRGVLTYSREYMGISCELLWTEHMFCSASNSVNCISLKHSCRRHTSVFEMLASFSHTNQDNIYLRTEELGPGGTAQQLRALAAFVTSTHTR